MTWLQGPSPPLAPWIPLPEREFPVSMRLWVGSPPSWPGPHFPTAQAALGIWPRWRSPSAPDPSGASGDILAGAGRQWVGGRVSIREGSAHALGRRQLAGTGLTESWPGPAFTRSTFQGCPEGALEMLPVGTPCRQPRRARGAGETPVHGT